MPDPAEIRQHPFLKQLPDSVQQSLAELAQVKTFEEGETILSRGNDADHFYLIVEGLVLVELESQDGNTIEIETLSKGAPLGWSWIVPPYSWQFTARAEDDVTVYALPADHLRDLCERDLELGYHLMKQFLDVVSERLAWTRMKLLDEQELDLPGELSDFEL